MLCSLLPPLSTSVSAEEPEDHTSHAAETVETVLPTEAVETALPAETGEEAPVVQADTASGTCGENATWAYSDGTLTISGYGDMTDYTYGSAPWYDFADQITTAVIEPGITRIGARAFHYCSKLKTFVIPDSVTAIGDYAFAYTGLIGIVIPGSVTSIGAYAFKAYDLDWIRFLGDAPEFANYPFDYPAAAYYPADNATWAEADCSGWSIWKPYVFEIPKGPDSVAADLDETVVFTAMASAYGAQYQWYSSTNKST